MKQPCVNEWCDAKVDRPVQKCGPCTRSEERTGRVMARVETEVKRREEAAK